MKSKDQERQIQMFRDAAAPASGKPAGQAKPEPSPKTDTHYSPNGDYKKKPSMADVERGEKTSPYAPCHVRGECVRETDRAILVVDDDGDEHWTPKSQILKDSEVREYGDTGFLSIPKWLFDKW